MLRTTDPTKRQASPLMKRALGASTLALLLLAAGCGGGGGGAAPDSGFALIFVTEPAQDLRVALFPVQTITIRFTDSNPPAGAVIDIVADRDGLPLTTDDQIVIASDITPLGGAEHVFPWEIGGIFNGDYVIFVRMKLGEERYIYGRAPGRVRINGFPTFAVTGPPTNVTISRGGLLCYGYSVADPEDTPVVALTLDADGDYRTTDDAYPLELPPNRGGCTLLETPEVPPDLYRIVGTADDGVNGILSKTAATTVEVKNVSWAKSWGGPGSASVVDMVTRDDGSTLVAGSFNGAVVMGAGEANQTAMNSKGGEDLYVALFNADGALAWARAWGGTGHDWISGLAPHPDGGFVLTGMYTNAITFGPGETRETTLRSATAGQDRYVARFASGGDVRWAKNRGGKVAGDEDRGGPIGVFPDGSMVTWGASQNRTVPPLSTMTGTLERLDADGNEVWTKTWSEYGQHWRPAFGHVRVLSDGGFLAVGRLTGTATFNAGTPDAMSFTAGSTTSADVLMAKFDGNGTLKWGKLLQGSTGGVVVSGLDLYEDDSFVVAGSYPNTLTLGPGEAGEQQRTSLGLRDGFVAWFDADGTFRRVRSFGSPVSPPGGLIGEGEDYGADVAVLRDGTCVLHAGVWGNVTLEDTGAPRMLPLGFANVNVLNVRFDANGTVRWLRTDGVWAAAAQLGPGRIEALPDGSCVSSGYFQGPIVLGAGEAKPVPLAAPLGMPLPFLTRFNADGKY